MNNTVLILYSCDNWKSLSTRELLGVYSNIDVLKERIKLEIKDDNMFIENLDSITDIGEINENLNYGIVEKIRVNDMNYKRNKYNEE